MSNARVSKRDFVRCVARRAGVPITVAERVYESVLVEVVSQVRCGKQVNFTGFGEFHAAAHKGHVAQFGAAGQGRLRDYLLLKFSASRVLNNFLELPDGIALKTRIPGTTRLLDEGMDEHGC